MRTLQRKWRREEEEEGNEWEEEEEEAEAGIAMKVTETGSRGSG